MSLSICMYVCMYMWNKTEKRDIWPSRTRRPFDVGTWNFGYFIIYMSRCSVQIFMGLSYREDGFSDGRKPLFLLYSHFYISYGLASEQCRHLKFRFLLIFSDFFIFLDMFRVWEEHQLVFFVLPCGLASPLIERDIYDQFCATLVGQSMHTRRSYDGSYER